MRCKVYYMSQRGSAEAIAEVVAGAALCQPEPLLPAYMPENVELMFLGCEGLRADKVTLQFIESLSPSRVRSAALFQCARARGDAIAQMRSALEARGIAVLDEALHTPVRSLMGSGIRPSDLMAARAFAKAALEASDARRQAAGHRA